MMKFKELELDFDLFDADVAETYEAAVQRVRQGNANRPAKEALADSIRRQCALVFDFFDDIFGDGFHRELFGERTNLLECLDSFTDFVEAANAQKAALDERMEALAVRTAGGATPNRAARRAAKRT